MDAWLLKNPAREKIVLALKKKGSMSVGELSNELDITTMGVRQHLLILEKNGIVEYFPHRQGIGRPGFLFKLTNSADDIFPKAYREFALDLLMNIEDSEGRAKIGSLFKKRHLRILDEKTRILSGKEKLSDKLLTFAEMLRNEGCIVETEEDIGLYRLMQFNCTISKIAFRYKEACDYDLLLFRRLFGEDVLREQCLSDGDQACVYLIPKKLKEN